MSLELGDRLDGDTIDFTFTTVNATGVPTVLTGSPALRVYKDNNIAQSVAGLTLTPDFDGLVGLNHVRLVLTDAFYVVATDYMIVIQAGTVAGNSVIGYTVGTFSIENRFDEVDVTGWLGSAAPALVGSRLDVSVGAMAANVLTAAAINANAFIAAKFAANSLDGKGDWNINKSGYSLTQAFPTNFAALSITAGGLVDFTQAAADKVWLSTTRTLTAISTAIAVAFWDVLESAVLIASSMGLKVKNNLDAVLTARTLASAAYFDPAADPVANVTLVATTTVNSDMRGTENAALASVCTEPRLAELDGGNLPTDVAATATPAQVATEISDALTVDTRALPAAAAPPAVPTIVEMLTHRYKAYRNKKEQDASEWRLFDDAGAAVQQKAVVSDVAGTATKEEIAAGP